MIGDIAPRERDVLAGAFLRINTLRSELGPILAAGFTPTAEKGSADAVRPEPPGAATADSDKLAGVDFPFGIVNGTLSVRVGSLKFWYTRGLIRYAGW